jgi:hypothetical protein
MVFRPFCWPQPALKEFVWSSIAPDDYISPQGVLLPGSTTIGIDSQDLCGQIDDLGVVVNVVDVEICFSGDLSNRVGRGPQPCS